MGPLDRTGQSSVAIDSLLGVNAIRTATLIIATLTLAWSLHRALRRSRGRSSVAPGSEAVAPQPAAELVAEPERLAALIDGSFATQLIYVAAELGIADVIADAPHTGAEVAPAAGGDPDVVTRVLRGLAALGLTEDHPDGRFGLTAAGALLRHDHPASQRGAAIARGRLYYQAQAGLLAAARGAGVPYELVHGRPFFDHLAADPERTAWFQASMDARAAREAAAVVAGYDFTRHRCIIDVGGGRGNLVRAISAAAPEATVVLFDRPEVVAGTLLDAHEGDFFVEVPRGADAYVLSRVLHDWDDHQALAVLGTVGKAMAGDATLVIVEAILPERASEHPAVIRMDLHMLTLLDAREQTVGDFARLLATAGFTLDAVTPVDPASGLHLLLARPSGPCGSGDIDGGRPAHRRAV